MAEAHCYSVWRYPWPQHCAIHVYVPRTAKRPPAASPGPANGDRSWYVEFLPDDEGRAAGIEALKRMLKR